MPIGYKNSEESMLLANGPAWQQDERAHGLSQASFIGGGMMVFSLQRVLDVYLVAYCLAMYIYRRPESTAVGKLVQTKCYILVKERKKSSNMRP